MSGGSAFDDYGRYDERAAIEHDQAMMKSRDMQDALASAQRRAGQLERQVDDLRAALKAWHAGYNDCYHAHYDDCHTDCPGCVAEVKLLELASAIDKVTP